MAVSAAGCAGLHSGVDPQGVGAAYQTFSPSEMRRAVRPPPNEGSGGDPILPAPVEVVRVGGGCDVEVHGRSPASVHLRGNTADHQIVDAVLGQRGEELTQVQRALRRAAHAPV